MRYDPIANFDATRCELAFEHDVARCCGTYTFSLASSGSDCTFYSYTWSHAGHRTKITFTENNCTRKQNFWT